MRGRFTILPALLILLTGGCVNDPVDGCLSDATPLQLDLPVHFLQMTVPEDNPLTIEGVALGRRLYYDPLLSQGGPRNGLSCSSCHTQANGFMLPGQLPSPVLPHVNLGWNSTFLWNGKEQGTLEDVMLFEVEQFFHTDIALLRSHPQYPDLFRRAMGTCDITSKDVAYALAQWFRRLYSADSRYDRYMRHELQLTDSELRGMVIFLTEKGDCFHCHIPPLFTDNGFHNIGLDSVFTGMHIGRQGVTGLPSDRGLFKTPTLRNAAVRGQFMHDGRFVSLEQVIEHYDSGVLRSSTVDPIMTKPGKEYGLQLSAQDRADLLAFLLALTDETFLSDTSLASPF